MLKYLRRARKWSHYHYYWGPTSTFQKKCPVIGKKHREMALMPAGTVSLILNDYIHVRIQILVCISKESFLSHLSIFLEFHEKKVFFTLEKSMLKISKTSNLYFLVVCFLQCFYCDLFRYTTALTTQDRCIYYFILMIWNFGSQLRSEIM